MSGNKEFHFFLPEQAYDAMQLLAKQRQVPCSAIMCSALEDYLQHKELEGVDLVLERIATLNNRVGRLRLDLESLGELLSFFIFYWFSYTPAPPDSQRKVLTLDGQKRHRQFLAQLLKKLERGDYSLVELLGCDESTEADDEDKDEPSLEQK